MKNIAVSEAVHRDLKVFSAKQGLAMSASVRLLITFWEQNQGRTLAAQDLNLPTDGAAGRTIGNPGAPAAPDEQQPNHYFYS